MVQGSMDYGTRRMEYLNLHHSVLYISVNILIVVRYVEAAAPFTLYIHFALFLYLQTLALLPYIYG